MYTRVDKPIKFGFDGGGVGVETRVVVKFGLENGMAVKFSVVEDVVSHTEHHAVTNRHLITRDVTRVVAGQLCLAGSQEESPLVLDQILVLLVLRSSIKHGV